MSSPHPATSAEQQAVSPGPSRPRWRRQLPVVAAVAAVLLVVAGVLIARNVGAHRAGAPPLKSAPPTGPAGLVVHDGDTAEASGIVLAEPSKPVRFCPEDAVAVADLVGNRARARTCGPFGVPVTGADLDRLADRQVNGSTVSGLATLRGVYTHGALRVTKQSAPPAPKHTDPEVSLPVFLRTPPCTPPAGGWRGQPDNSAIGGYINRYPERFNAVGVSYPKTAVWDPKNIGYDTWVAVVGVFRGDLAQAQAELRRKFGGNICTVRVHYSLTEQLAAQHAVEQLVKDHANGIYAASGVGNFRAIGASIIVLTPQLFDKLSAIGLHELALDVWLKPVR
jgi:hypothetical protein